MWATALDLEEEFQRDSGIQKLNQNSIQNWIQAGLPLKGIWVEFVIMKGLGEGVTGRKNNRSRGEEMNMAGGKLIEAESLGVVWSNNE